MTAAPMTAASKPGCPICGRPADPEFRPFCTKRCADVDLGRWFNERYVVPEPAEPEDSDPVSEDGDEAD